MTKITYDNGALSLTVVGHAGVADGGDDLVCCAISTLTETLIAALQDNHIHRSCEMDETDGFIRVRAFPSEEMYTPALIIFDTIASGLAGIAMEYPEYVSYNTDFTMPVRKGE